MIVCSLSEDLLIAGQHNNRRNIVKPALNQVFAALLALLPAPFQAYQQFEVTK
jgi:hypothetical protein